MQSVSTEARPAFSNRNCCVLRQTRTLFTAAWMKLKYRARLSTSPKKVASITKSCCWQFTMFLKERQILRRCEFSRQGWTSANYWSTSGSWSSANIHTTWRWGSLNVPCFTWDAHTAATKAFVVHKLSSWDSSAIPICRGCWSRRRVCRRNICATWFASRPCTSWSNFSTPLSDFVSIPARCFRHWVRFCNIFQNSHEDLTNSPSLPSKFCLNNRFANWLNFSPEIILLSRKLLVHFS